MSELEDDLDALASATGVSGVVRVDRADGIEVANGYGLAHRGYGIANEVDIQRRAGTARRASEWGVLPRAGASPRL